MFVHNKDLQFEVRVDAPDPRFASLLMEQFGGANGELTAGAAIFHSGLRAEAEEPNDVRPVHGHRH